MLDGISLANIKSTPVNDQKKSSPSFKSKKTAPMENDKFVKNNSDSNSGTKKQNKLKTAALTLLGIVATALVFKAGKKGLKGIKTPFSPTRPSGAPPVIVAPRPVQGNGLRPPGGGLEVKATPERVRGVKRKITPDNLRELNQKPLSEESVLAEIKASSIKTSDAIKKIQKGELGRVRGLDELNADDIMKLVNQQLMPIEASEISSIINSLPRSEQATATKLLDRMTQFGNMNSLDDMLGQINKANGNGIFVDETISLASSLRYINQKDSFINKHVFNPASGTCIIDDIVLNRLETDKDFLNKIVSNPNIKLAYPEGWVDGMNVYSQTKDLKNEFSTVFEKLNNIKRQSPSISDEQAISQVLNISILDRLKKLGINKEIKIIRNAEKLHGSQLPTAQSIANNLKPDGMTKAQLEEIYKKFPKEYEPYINEVLANGMNVSSPRSMGFKLQNLHERILSASGGDKDKIYYFVSDMYSSYSLVNMQYQLVNKISPDKIITSGKALIKIPKDATVVLLDDVAGSGDSLSSAYHKLLTTCNAKNIIISPMIASNRAIKKFTSYGIPGLKFIPGEFQVAFDKSKYYLSIKDTAEGMKMHKVLQNGGYGDYLNVAFPYMSPDNNNALFSTQFAPFFTLNGKGVKNSCGYYYPVVEPRSAPAGDDWLGTYKFKYG